MKFFKTKSYAKWNFTGGADSDEFSEKSSTESDEYEIGDFKENEEPWIDFKKWKEKKTWNLRKRQESKLAQDHEPNFSDDQAIPPTEFEDSSISWEPDKNEDSDTSSELQSCVSKEIQPTPTIQYKGSVNNMEINICQSSFKNVTKEKSIKKRSLNALPEITYPLSQHESLFVQQNDNESFRDLGLNLTCETQNSVPVRNEINTYESSKIKILQNIVLPPSNKSIDQNKKALSVPTKEETNVSDKKEATTKTERKNLNIHTFGVIGVTKSTVEISHRKSRIWDKRDRCIYCDRDFTNFSRHLFRNHKEEESVRKIMQLPKGDQKRRQMINLLRKEGNLSLVDENKIRPVQRATTRYERSGEISEEAQEFLPCPYCKGIYRLKSLRKHSKTCLYNPKNDERCNVASLGQNLLVFKASRKPFLDTLRLKTEVFSKMHADRASFNGKNDPVICQYAEDYLRKHKTPHIQHAVSNKVRELGRLLIALQDVYDIKSMLEAMNTKHYDKVVHAAHIISGYDPTSKTFKAPSLAMHLKTILLAASLAAKTLLLKQNPVLPVLDYTEALKPVKQFRLLVDERWKFDMGSLALKDLNEKHGKQIQKLPITSDVIKFREYAVTRVGDVQYIKVDSYTQITTGVNQEECLNALSEQEKLLSKHFKRIITIGKGSKSILFPTNVQKYVDALLFGRENNQLVPKENPFLFALIGSKDKWIDGSSVLRKYALSSGATHSKTLTSSRLRKQIATVLQVINLNETEKEQVASFMGHTKKTHEEFYRLPQDVYQTAKIAKLLLMMDKGEGAEFQGKTLEEIDIQLENLEKKRPLNEDSDEKSYSEECELHIVTIKHLDAILNPFKKFNKEQNVEIPGDENKEVGGGSKSKKKKIQEKEKKEKQRGTWNSKQKSVMMEYFKKNIKNKITPKNNECDAFQNKYRDMFQDKTWLQIKVFIYNVLRKQ
ncbi:unnamed protein product [Brassicogethes aeneus]|uniref:Uncharacterized protein n=1 Tax=Brassicogethes aeneus TaxID=1431903 RepID=A0A9P0BJB1_BRAAE|nr:unnamed protein product [Brassicogethes aeneus]